MEGCACQYSIRQLLTAFLEISTRILEIANLSVDLTTMHDSHGQDRTGVTCWAIMCTQSLQHVTHLEDAERGLGEHDVDQLLVHFKAQCHYHTKPLPQQSKNPGRREIDHILSLKGTLEVERSALEDLLRKEMHQVSDSAADMVCAD